MRAKFAVVIVGLVIAATAAALEIDGVKLDERVSVGGRDLLLNGAGVRRKLIFKVYVGSLYVVDKAGTSQAVLAQTPRRIQLNLLRNLSATQFVDALIEGLRENSTATEMAAIKAETDELVAIMSAFGEAKEGSVVTLDFADGATRIGFNGIARGSIAGAAFNRALTNIWLGEKPVQADLKKAMLGGA